MVSLTLLVFFQLPRSKCDMSVVTEAGELHESLLNIHDIAIYETHDHIDCKFICTWHWSKTAINLRKKLFFWESLHDPWPLWTCSPLTKESCIDIVDIYWYITYNINVFVCQHKCVRCACFLQSSKWCVRDVFFVWQSWGLTFKVQNKMQYIHWISVKLATAC